MTSAAAPTDASLRAVALAAVALVTDGATVGLGSGRAAAAFVDELGARVRDGLRVMGVPTSTTTARQAGALGIPLVELTEDLTIELTVDGADEVAPNLDLVKGWGGAMVRERVVAAASRRQVILVGPEKLVPVLGTRGRIPVEVVPFARDFVAGRLRRLGLTPTLRRDASATGPLLSDNGNVTLDCAPDRPLKAEAVRALAADILAIPGVVDSGLFLGTAERVLVGHPDGRVDVLTRTA